MSSAKVCVPPFLLVFLAFFLFGREEVARAFSFDLSEPLAHSSLDEGILKHCFMFSSVGAHTNVWGQSFFALPGHLYHGAAA